MLMAENGADQESSENGGDEWPALLALNGL